MDSRRKPARQRDAVSFGRRIPCVDHIEFKRESRMLARGVALDDASPSASELSKSSRVVSMFDRKLGDRR